MEQYVKYLRKSRFDRDYAELSIEETLKRHEAILDKMANDRGYCIAKTYYEVVSGESIAARPEIQKMLEEVSAGLYAGVLVVDVERLARGNGADQAYISQVFQFSGTKIITPMKVYDPSNEFDEEYFEFGLFMSRREYKTINRQLIRGRDSSASEGKYLGSIALMDTITALKAPSFSTEKACRILRHAFRATRVTRRRRPAWFPPGCHSHGWGR
ncbi:MAG: recombinase family protein [Clostridiales bacterium]|nr:recombinase family protein [Clostridiales bacterium]